MNRFYFIVFLFLIEFFLSVSLSNVTKVSVLCVGKLKNATNQEVDPSPFNLDLLRYTYDTSRSEIKPTFDVDFYEVPENCTPDFDWEDASNNKFLEIFGESKTGEYALHIGPLCEYAELEAAKIEIAGFMTDIINETKQNHYLFVTPTVAVHIINEVNNFRHQPLFISLNSNIDFYANLIFKFSIKYLSPYTAFLCPVQAYLGNTDRFCRHLTDALMRKSGAQHQNFVRFRYFGSKDEREWLDIWNHVLQRSRYIVYCGDESYFAQWLTASKQLWQHKIEQFAIFFLTINFESSGYKTQESSEELFGQLLINVSSIGNIKILNIRSPVECKEVSKFCRKVMTDWTRFVDYPQTATEMNRFIFKNKLMFHLLGVYKLLNAMFSKPNHFWKHRTNEKAFEHVYNITKELEVFEVSRENGRLVMKSACTLQKIGNYTQCDLSYIDGIPPQKKPGECGYQECFRKENVKWTYIVYAVSGVIVFGLLIATISVFCYLRYRRIHEWSVTPLGEVRIKIEEVKLQVQHEELHTKFGSTKKLKVLESLSQVIVLDSMKMNTVLGTYRSTPIIVQPFKVAKNRVNSVDSAVTKLRALTLENVAQIHGYVVQAAPHVHGLVMEYGEHGNLLSLLKLDELDLALKLPLLADLCRALEHIHKSSLKHHGNLSSVCCVVDSHFVLKVQLTEFPTLNKLAPEETQQQTSKNDLNKLWSAPEVLRNQAAINLQLADIYSFGIIAHEIIYQKGTFFISKKDLISVTTDGSLPKSAVEIGRLVIEILQNKQRHQIRPTFVSRAGEESVMLLLKEMIKLCWEDNPTQRCSLNKISQCLKKVMHDMRIVNVFGSMVERLEYYSKHLQEAVQQKADKVERERHRVRDVLQQLFPGISRALINGEKPKPMQYKNICVYYNDLVGFTKICSVNTPSTVVKFLNTLFLKYDGIIEKYYIHPITRIGDAYMLVSGIPSETDDRYHASEIAQAALQLVEAVRSTVFDYVEQYKSMQIRTGIASGRAATGVVGTEIPSFGICGDAVVMASKMESSSEAMKILVADSTFVLLKDKFDFELATKEVKLKTSIVTAHWLQGMKTVPKIILGKRLDGGTGPSRKFADGSLTLN